MSWKISQGVQLIHPAVEDNNLGSIDEQAAKRLFGDIGDIPTVLCSICGTKKSGKFILFKLLVQYFAVLEEKGENQLHENFKATVRNDFETEASPCTDGVVISNKPFFIKTKKYKKVALFFLDAPGIGQKFSSEDKRIVAVLDFCTVVSSFQLFCVKESVKSNDLAWIKLYAEYGEKLGQAGIDRIYPNLMFAVLNGKQSPPGNEAGQKHLEKIINENRRNGFYAEEIKKAFVRLDYVALPDKCKAPNRMAKTNKESLDESFLDAFCELADHIRTHLVVRATKDGLATGKSVLAMIRTAVDILEDSKRQIVMSKLFQDTSNVDLYKRMTKMQEEYLEDVLHTFNPARATKTDVGVFQDNFRSRGVATIEAVGNRCCPIYVYEQVLRWKKFLSTEKAIRLREAMGFEVDPDGQLEACQQIVKQSVRIYKRELTRLDGCYVPGDEFHDVEKAAERLAQSYLKDRLLGTMPGAQILLFASLLRDKLKLILSEKILQVNAEQKIFQQRVADARTNSLRIYCEAFEACFGEDPSELDFEIEASNMYMHSYQFEILSQVAAEKAVTEFSNAFIGFGGSDALYELCLEEFMARIRYLKQLFEQKRQNQVTELQKFYKGALAGALQVYHKSRSMSAATEKQDLFQRECTAQHAAVRHYISVSIENEKAVDWCRDDLNRLCNDELKVCYEKFVENARNFDYETEISLEQAIETYREEMKTCFELFGEAFETAHEKALKKSKKVMMSSKYWNAPDTKKSLEAKLDSRILTEKETFLHAHRSNIEKEDTWAKAVSEAMQEYGHVIFSKLPARNDSRASRKDQEKAAATVMSKLNAKSKFSKSCEASLKKLLAGEKASQQELSRLKEKEKLLQSRIESYNSERTDSNLAMLSFVSPNQVFCSESPDDVLCHGRFSTVRLARSDQHGQVAVKCYPITAESEEVNQRTERLFEKIELFHLHSHENVIKVLGYTCWKGHVAMLTEYASSGSLAALLLKSSNQLPEQFLPMLVRLRFCVDILSGLLFLLSNQTLCWDSLDISDILLSCDFRCKVSACKFSNLIVKMNFNSDSNGATDMTRTFADILHAILLPSEASVKQPQFLKKTRDSTEEITKLKTLLTEDHQVRCLKALQGELKLIRESSPSCSLFPVRDRLESLLSSQDIWRVHAAVATLATRSDVARTAGEMAHPICQIICEKTTASMQ